MAGASLVVRNIGELATCDPARGSAPGVVRDAALCAAGGVITYVGPEAGLASAGVAPDAVEIDARGMAVVPGFVDAHTHIVWLGDRGSEYARRAEGVPYAQIAAEGGGIMSTVRATAAGSVDELVAAARARAARMLELGTTTVEVKSGYGRQLDAELRQLEAARELAADPALPSIVATYLPLHAAPPEPRADFIDRACTEGMRHAAPLASFVDAFCERGAYTVEECEQLLRAAQEAGLGLKLHADQLTHSGAAALAARMGATSADHLEHATDDDLRALAAAGTTGVILPGASLVLGGPPPPGRRLRDAGATVAIATDCNPGTCWSESMPLMVSLAVATAGLTPAEALWAATAGGAAALALPDRGILREGRRADLCVLDSPHWIDVAYHLGHTPVAHVVNGGVPARR